MAPWSPSRQSLASTSKKLFPSASCRLVLTAHSSPRLHRQGLTSRCCFFIFIFFLFLLLMWYNIIFYAHRFELESFFPFLLNHYSIHMKWCLHIFHANKSTKRRPRNHTKMPKDLFAILLPQGIGEQAIERKRAFGIFAFPCSFLWCFVCNMLSMIPIKLLQTGPAK